MIGQSLIRKIIPSRNERLIKKLSKTVDKINKLEPEFQSLSDDALRAKTDEFKQRLEQGSTLDSLLPEAFAAVRETSVRTLGMRHFDVQLIGGMVLHYGKIAEMGTGEGKTLMATLPAYLNALSGKGVHIITVNDYLAKRDAQWMSPIYSFLGMTVGSILTDMTPQDRQTSYNADITYGTNNEFGFDYLRDNMAFDLSERVQRDLNFAVVDEVDSILIDEARTPLIISGPTEDSSELYQRVNQIIPQLQQAEDKDSPGDFYLIEKERQAYFTEQGHEKVETILLQQGFFQEGESLYDAKNITLMHHLGAALRAHTLFNRNVDYIVQGGKIVIVDEHTGRTMPGRRWSDGLHQAIEAKENVAIENENQTLASITFQNYFRLYNKLAGMTGTADTEAFEFQQIYGLEVVVIPTNKPCVRIDAPDLVYLKAKDKFDAILAQVKDCQQRGQPILLGTASIETSEFMSKLLDKAKVKHQVLNAKFHEKEAKIIAEAGRPGAVTIATNMAGRGTDIVLGGDIENEISELNDPSEEKIKEVRQAWQTRHDQVLEAGGLFVIGSERHEARRIDNQLRGRCGRQGDPGASRFYLSLEDNLLRIFAADRLTGIMQRFGMQEGEALESSMLTRVIENAQRKVEGHNFDVRKQLLEYDNVANDQRRVMYEQRSELLHSDDISDTILNIRKDVVYSLMSQYIPPETLEEEWDVPGLEEKLKQEFQINLEVQKWLDEENDLHEEPLRDRITERLENVYDQKVEMIGNENAHAFEKSVMLQVLDNNWREHLGVMDHLRQGIHLRGYPQKNPKQEYKHEAFRLFSEMLDNIKYEVIRLVSTVQVQAQEDIEALEQQRRHSLETAKQYEHASMASVMAANEMDESDEEMAHVPYHRDTPKVGRNDPCPCGSNKKFKHCHGRLN